MVIILHIAKQEQWEQAKGTGVYTGDTFESEGFIHCSTPKQIIKVANALFHGQKGLVLLVIDSDKVKSKILYEGVEGSERYPHIYGPLNIDAIVKVLKFEPKEDGTFKLPSFLKH
ncbi:DUF952 domain-containing protein [Candidatus Bathyarchaeota archaeon]|nr:DUF952 domain-containing protein [Candidatus Bathyarchaeota archaeon]